MSQPRAGCRMITFELFSGGKYNFIITVCEIFVWRKLLCSPSDELCHWLYIQYYCRVITAKWCASSVYNMHISRGVELKVWRSGGCQFVLYILI